MQQVIDAGVESGSAIATELLKSSENVLKANTLVAQTDAIAQRIGELSASKFYAAGVSNAQQYLAGVEAAMAVAQARLGVKGIKLADVKGISASFNEAIATPSIVAPNMPALIPRQELDARRGIGSTTINITGGLATTAEMGELVNNALRAYNRAAGPLDLQIA